MLRLELGVGPGLGLGIALAIASASTSASASASVLWPTCISPVQLNSHKRRLPPKIKRVSLQPTVRPRVVFCRRRQRRTLNYVLLWGTTTPSPPYLTPRCYGTPIKSNIKTSFFSHRRQRLTVHHVLWPVTCYAFTASTELEVSADC